MLSNAPPIENVLKPAKAYDFILLVEPQPINHRLPSPNASRSSTLVATFCAALMAAQSGSKQLNCSSCNRDAKLTTMPAKAAFKQPAPSCPVILFSTSFVLVEPVAIAVAPVAQQKLPSSLAHVNVCHFARTHSRDLVSLPS